MARPDWHTYFLQIAQVVATRSTCDRAHVGCVLVRQRQILSTGYNGAPSGLPSCDEVGHLMIGSNCQRTVHSEANAIIQAALHGVSTQGSVLYVTHTPCLQCAKMLINAGIQAIYYVDDYRAVPETMDLLQKAGIGVTRVELAVSE